MAESSQNCRKKSSDKDDMECAVCLQTCIHPCKLPCGHIFCFLCVKGIANQSKKCAMCRQEIPRDFIDQPNLLTVPNPDEPIESFEDGYQWFYEGRNGWWQYEERTSKELEISYKGGDKTYEILIAGFLYIVDFENMVQMRRNDPSRRRAIKRDLASAPKKGIAGLRTDYGQESIQHSHALDIGLRSTEVSIPRTPANTPQNSTSGSGSPDTNNLLESLSALSIDASTALNSRNTTNNDHDENCNHCHV